MERSPSVPGSPPAPDPGKAPDPDALRDPGNGSDPGAGFEVLGVSQDASCAVKLHVFEGPLDLLLHLIRLNEVEITDIPVARIAEQYLEYLEVMHDLNIDVAAEYLLMAATLAWIKSRMLLPRPETEEDAEESDPRAELVARLLEYRRFKEVSEELSRRRRLGRDVFEASIFTPDGPSNADAEIEVGLFELLRAFREVVKRAKVPAHHELDVERITVRERMDAVMGLLDSAESVEFSRIFTLRDEALTRTLLVATFLAILELARLGALRIYQGKSEDGVPEGPIRLRQTGGVAGQAWNERVSELM